ncbi:hypothetical protein PJV92_10305 [Aliarcobacter butzleri]|uniref:Uncharacterized protein n=1 Tax=Aliarcobacter butzleri TaxID=28197 RepID=A0AAP4UZ93_9BACT|nr:hypothetical protein [Aliarcobacter butzleri]MDN5052884.1 hypothetical protein [Aliarcobacter butzleri]MDN5117303.1 hypothetical protein [Aliarcobacter butzleri]MDN5133113.1 hypothetical protein [Aliarcobacter butzleri]
MRQLAKCECTRWLNSLRPNTDGFIEISQAKYQEVIDLKETCIKYQSCADVLSDILEDNKIKRYEFDKFNAVLEEEIENEKRMKKSKENLEREKLNKEIFEQIKKELKDKK